MNAWERLLDHTPPLPAKCRLRHRPPIDLAYLVWATLRLQERPQERADSALPTPPQPIEQAVRDRVEHRPRWFQAEHQELPDTHRPVPEQAGKLVRLMELAVPLLRHLGGDT